MTSKTARTLALIDALAGVTHLPAAWQADLPAAVGLHESRPLLVVPQEAFSFYDLRQLANNREAWRSGRGKYDTVLLFKVKGALA